MSISNRVNESSKALDLLDARKQNSLVLVEEYDRPVCIDQC